MPFCSHGAAASITGFARCFRGGCMCRWTLMRARTYSSSKNQIRFLMLDPFYPPGARALQTLRRVAKF